MYKTVRACVGSGCSLTPGCRCVEPAQPSSDCFCCFQSNHMKIVAAPPEKNTCQLLPRLQVVPWNTHAIIALSAFRAFKAEVIIIFFGWG